MNEYNKQYYQMQPNYRENDFDHPQTSSPSSHDRFVSISKRAFNYLPLSEIKRKQKLESDHAPPEQPYPLLDTFFPQLSEINDVRNVKFKEDCDNFCDQPSTEYASFLNGGVPAVNNILLQGGPTSQQSNANSRQYADLPKDLNLESSPIRKREAASSESERSSRASYSRKRKRRDNERHSQFDKPNHLEVEHLYNREGDTVSSYNHMRSDNNYEESRCYQPSDGIVKSNRRMYDDRSIDNTNSQLPTSSDRRRTADYRHHHHSNENRRESSYKDRRHKEKYNSHYDNYYRSRDDGYEDDRGSSYRPDYNYEQKSYKHAPQSHIEYERNSSSYDRARNDIYNSDLEGVFSRDKFIDVSQDNISINSISDMSGDDGDVIGGGGGKGRRHPMVDKKPLTYEEYSELANTFDEHRKALADIKQEITRLKRQEGDLLRRKRWEVDVQNDPEVLEINRMLQSAFANEEELTLKVSNLKSKVQLYSNDYQSNKSDKKPKSDINYVYKDAGRYWCENCNVINDSLSQVFKHLRSQDHLEKFKSCDTYPWSAVEKTGKKGKTVELPCIKGVEFLMPAEAFYCQICRVFLGDNKQAELHLTSKQHHDVYDEHISKFPNYEKALEDSIKLTLEKIERVQQKQPKSDSKIEIQAGESGDTMDCQVSSSSKEALSQSGKTPLPNTSNYSKLFQQVKPKSASLKIDLNLHKSKSVPFTQSHTTTSPTSPHNLTDTNTSTSDLVPQEGPKLRVGGSVPVKVETPPPLDEFLQIEPVEMDSGAQNRNKIDKSPVEEGLIESSSDSENMSDYEVIEECD